MLKKKFFTVCFAMFLIYAALIGAGAAFAGETGVIYRGNAGEFVFETKSVHAPDDLFENFKGVMPGDVLTQNIIVRYEEKKDTKLRLYLRSEGAGEESKEFLSKLSLKVKQDGREEAYESTANQAGGLTEWICLGTFYEGEETKLELKLTIPKALGNEYQNSIGEIRWEFMAEEYPLTEGDPKTGDNSNVFLYIAVLVASGIGVSYLIYRKKRKPDRWE